MARSSDSPRRDGRDGKGRFAKGNPGGPGNPTLVRLGQMRAAVREAITPDDLQNVLRGLRDKATKGDSQAASVLLVHVLGRPREAVADFHVELPADLATAKGITGGMVAVARAVASGQVPDDVGERLTAMLSRVGEVAVLSQLEEIQRRLDSIEQGSAS